MKITLVNTFHNTNMNLTISDKRLKEFGNNHVLEISRATYKKIFKTLCGSKECQCGGTYGDKKTVFQYIDVHGDKLYYIDLYENDKASGGEII